MSPSWIWSDKITNEHVARVGYNHFISNKGTWNNCFSKFSNRVLPPIFISTILQSVWKENLLHYFPYDVKLGLLVHSRSFLANQKARNAIVRAENLLISHTCIPWLHWDTLQQLNEHSGKVFLQLHHTPSNGHHGDHYRPKVCVWNQNPLQDKTIRT